MSSDGWSSLDDTSSDTSSSSESSSPRPKRRLSLSPRKPLITTANDSEGISTRDQTPATAKNERKSALETLARKRRESLSKRKFSQQQTSSESDGSRGAIESFESSSFVASDDGSDAEESSSLSSNSNFLASSDESESEADFGFYARVSNKLNERDRKSGVGSMSPRAAFLLLLKYYGICLLTRGGEFPFNDKQWRKMRPQMEAAVLKIEGSILDRRKITTPSYWKPDSDLVVSLNQYPSYQRSHIRRVREKCDACSKGAQLSATITLKGSPYDSELLWRGNIQAWLKSMQLCPFWSKDKDGSSDSERGYSGNRGPEMVFGDKCLSNFQIYHTLQHWKHRTLLSLYRWMQARRLVDPDQLVETLEAEKDGMVEQWFSTYKEDSELSERNCSRFTDPLGSHSPPPLASSGKKMKSAVHT